MAIKHYRPGDEQLNKIIAASDLLPMMSNRKWVKLLDALVAHASEVKECRVKLLWETETQVRHLLIDEFLLYDFDYYEQAMEAMITGKPRGWYAYREIEWLEFPGVATVSESSKPDKLVMQAIDLLQKVIDQAGLLQTSLTADSLRVDAYLRPAQPAL
ncbi:MAG: hypothetical protein EOO40_04910 [Deltaproteobacteria bacterium]|nr:MAG: hypothetical protein EOO40_04910 [Deltaproteobacteria bacterium]